MDMTSIKVMGTEVNVGDRIKVTLDMGWGDTMTRTGKVKTITHDGYYGTRMILRDGSRQVILRLYGSDWQMSRFWDFREKDYVKGVEVVAK